MKTILILAGAIALMLISMESPAFGSIWWGGTKERGELCNPRAAHDKCKQGLRCCTLRFPGGTIVSFCGKETPPYCG